MTSTTYLPTGRTVAVPFVLEIRHVLHHPLVDLRQRESLFRDRADRLGDEVRVRLVAPCIPPARRLFGGTGGYHASGLRLLLWRVQRTDTGRWRRGRRRRSTYQGTTGGCSHHHVQELRRAAVGHLRPTVLGIGPGQRPRVGPGPLQRFQTVIHIDERRRQPPKRIGRRFI